MAAGTTTYLPAEEGLDPPHPAVAGALLGLRRRVRVRRLLQLAHVVPLLLGPLHQLAVHLLVHVRLPAQDPEVVEGGLADERVGVGVVDVEHPVVADDGEDGEERGHVELDLELGLVADRVGAVGGALDVAAAAVGPRLVEHLHGAVAGERVGGARVGAVPGLEPRREARDLVPPPHVPLQVEVPHPLPSDSPTAAAAAAWCGGEGFK